MSDLDIEHQKETPTGGFYVKEDGEVLAEMTYELAGDEKMVIDHTWVDGSLRGRGVARKLLGAAIGFAREEHFHVIPRCSYVRSQMEKREELRDVLDPSFEL